MEFNERFPGFSNRQECAMLYWRASCLDIMAATTWFHTDRTREGICAIISEAIGTEVEKGGGDMPAS